MRFATAIKGVAIAGVASLAILSPTASAHHSNAMFDSEQEVTVQGIVREFQWNNPHAYIQVVATNEDGTEVEWSMEMGAPMYLYARGWRPRTLRPGSEIIVRANPLRNGDPGGVVLDVTDKDGNQIGINQ